MLRFFLSSFSLFYLSHFKICTSFPKDKVKLKKEVGFYLGAGDYFALLEIFSQVGGLEIFS